MMEKVKRPAYLEITKKMLSYSLGLIIPTFFIFHVFLIIENEVIFKGISEHSHLLCYFATLPTILVLVCAFLYILFKFKKN